MAKYRLSNEAKEDLIRIHQLRHRKVWRDPKINWNLSFTIDSIHDGRCPRDYMCLVAGDISFFFSINQGHKETDTLIYFYNRKSNPFTIAGYKWTILEVKPLPEYPVTYNLKDVEVTMIITKE